VNANSGNLNLGASSGNAFSYNADGTSTLALYANNGNTISVYGPINNGGGGTVTYAGANTYTGQTDINAGTLQINSGGSINSSSGIYLGNGTMQSSTA